MNKMYNSPKGRMTTFYKEMELNQTALVNIATYNNYLT